MVPEGADFSVRRGAARSVGRSIGDSDGWHGRAAVVSAVSLTLRGRKLGRFRVALALLVEAGRLVRPGQPWLAVVPLPGV
jgi:hypothetical protein